MQTKVVNIFKDHYDIYIGRPGKGKSGYWGNPIVINKECPMCGLKHDREASIICYESYIEYRIGNDLEFRNKLKSLKGKVLGCFCKPKLCHGDIMIKYINILNEEK